MPSRPSSGAEMSGRQSTLTPAVADLIVKAVSAGLPLVQAASMAGVGKAAVLQWVQRGQGLHPTRPAAQRYVDFVDQREKGRSQDMLRRVLRIEHAAKGGVVLAEKVTHYLDGRIMRETKYTEPQWTADAWHLERSYPEHWGRRAQVDRHLTMQRAAERIASEMGLSVEEILREAQMLLKEIDDGRA